MTDLGRIYQDSGPTRTSVLVLKAVKQMRNNKAPGPSGITAEMIKASKIEECPLVLKEKYIEQW